MKSHAKDVTFLSKWCNRLYRDKLKEESRKRKLETYKETGSWPGMKKVRAESTPWSKSKEKNAKKHEKKIAAAQRKGSHKKLSEAEILLLEKAFPGGEKV